MAGLIYLLTTPLELISLPFGSPVTITGGLFLFAWLIALVKRRVRLPQATGTLVLLGLYVSWCGLTIGWSFSPGSSLVQNLVTLMLAFSAVAIAGVFRGKLAAPSWAFLLGTLALCALTLSGGKQLYGYQGLTLEGQQYTFDDVDQNALSFNMMLGLAAALYLLLASRSRLARFGVAGATAVIVGTLILVGSRTALGSMLMLLLIFLLLAARSIGALISSVILVAISLLPIRVLADSGRIPPRLLEWVANPVANDSRVEIIDLYREHFGDWAFFGVGTGSDATFLLAASGLYKNAHSAFWKVWIETGAVGLVLWSALLIALGRLAYRSVARNFFFLMTPPIVAFFYTLGPLNSNMLWAVYGLALGAPVMAAASQSRQARTELSGGIDALGSQDPQRRTRPR